MSVTLSYPKSVSPTAIPSPLAMTPAQYHEFLRSANEKYEYENGKVIPMPGASPEHNFIQMDLSVFLSVELQKANASCEVVGSDQKVYVSPTIYYLPDIVVYCGNGQFDENDCLRNPVAIVEVLSDSTRERDTGIKSRQFRQIPSLQHSVLVEQYAVAVTHLTKNEAGRWEIAGEHTELTDNLMLLLGGQGIAVPLSAIYRRVSFDAVDSSEAA